MNFNNLKKRTYHEENIDGTKRKTYSSLSGQGEHGSAVCFAMFLSHCRYPVAGLFFCLSVFLALLAFLPLGLAHKRIWIAKAILSGNVLILTFTFIQVPFVEIENQSKIFQNKLNGKGPGAFGFFEKAGIYQNSRESHLL